MNLIKSLGLLLALSPVIPVLAASPMTDTRAERMAAWNDTIVSVDETVPNAALLTYDRSAATEQDTFLLAKLLVFVQPGGQTIGPKAATNIQAQDFPGGVNVDYQLGEVAVHCEYVPLFVGRDTPGQDGVLAVRLTTTPPVPAEIRIGGGRRFILRNSKEYLIDEAFDSQGDRASVTDATFGLLHSSRIPQELALKTDGLIQPLNESLQTVKFNNGQGWLLLAYNHTPEKALALIRNLNPDQARRQVDDYYRQLLETRIETPEKVMNEAFRSALYNMEYNWLEQPAGWIECIHHWVSMYHQEHTAAAEWIGQPDRARRAIQAQADKMKAGWVGSFNSNGDSRIVFGGTQQFFTRQIEHHWKFTADRNFLSRMAAPLDQVLSATLARHDPADDGLLDWGSQVGNQEDFITHPYASSGGTLQGLAMLQTRQMMAAALGDQPQEQRCRAQIAKAKTNMRRVLWKQNLGRLIYYQDSQQTEALEGQYYDYIQPVLRNLVDPLDGWTGLRHLRDRLIDQNGVLYVGNNFPCHLPAPGMQGNAVQQPWGTMALAAAGLRNEAWLPLKGAAQWVMNDFFRGSWMEHNSVWHEIAYFSPPAALYIQATVEGIFGLQMDRPNQRITISPCFPDQWPTASLHLPEYQVQYRHEGHHRSYILDTKDSLGRTVKWKLPPGQVRKLRVDGKKKEYLLEPAIESVQLEFDIPPATRSQIELDYEPLEYTVQAPQSLAQGEAFTVQVDHCIIKKIDDRCGVLSSIAQRSGHSLEATVAPNLLDDYLGFGRLGLMNFSRRTFFLELEDKHGCNFWQSVTVTVLPRYEVAPLGEIKSAGPDGTLSVQLRNNTEHAINGKAQLELAGQFVALDLDLPQRAERPFDIKLSGQMLEQMAPGENPCKLMLPNDETVTFKATLNEVYKTNPALAAKVQPRMSCLPLPAAAMIPDTQWRQMRLLRAQPNTPWSQIEQLKTGLPLDRPVKVPGLDLVEFHITSHDFIPVSRQMDRPSFTLPLDDATYAKLYLLVLPLLDNHNTFSAVARVTLTTPDEQQIARTLRIPGDLDWFLNIKLAHWMATVRNYDRNCFGLLPLLPANQGDWAEGKPANFRMPVEAPGFPQSAFWATCRPLLTEDANLNVVEIDCPKSRKLKSLTFATISDEAAFGLLAVSAVR